MLVNILIHLIKAYKQYLSPLLPQSCRFYPTCSEYSIISFQRYGLVKGLWLTSVRLLKCHPFHPGGLDLVP